MSAWVLIIAAWMGHGMAIDHVPMHDKKTCMDAAKLVRDQYADTLFSGPVLTCVFTGATAP